ncbi:MAG: S24 family peptidase [Cyanobacteria bacterium P01_H01_bin.74]
MVNKRVDKKVDKKPDKTINKTARPPKPSHPKASLIDGYIHTDLNARYIKNPIATYLFTANTDAIEGIRTGDLLIVDRALTASHGNVIVAEIDGDYHLKRFLQFGNRMVLRSDVKDDAPVYPDEKTGLCCGVVTHAIRSL